ncbi:MAG TPA: hypothetical protein P5016_02465 [Verrucomicrobiales bacterium]|nr:hypothetical protein [Verrucomicrobiales bacterium]
MKVSILLSFFALSLMSLAGADPGPLKYPETRKSDASDDYHGTRVADPYRWLEDDNSLETGSWVRAQNEVTFGYLKTLPQRSKIIDRLSSLWNYDRTGMPSEYGGRWFYTRNTGLQNQSVLFTTTSLDKEPQVLLDPNLLSTDGTVALTKYR